MNPNGSRNGKTRRTFATPDFAPGKEKLYVLDMFPYPSGDGLHVGHPEGYTATDIVCRFSRMRGKHVLHPMGWDAFGLPAEQHAKKTGTHPRTTTDKNIDTFRRQLKMLGFSYDWNREFATTDPDYFRWTQWIFLVLFDTWFDRDCEWTGPDGRKRKGRGRPIAELPIPDEVRRQGTEAVRRYQDKHRLAYQSFAPVNWCPALGTVLANEEVIGGMSERGGHPVTRSPLRQWMLRITAYADRLVEDLDELDWSESIKTLQRNWIGRSEGAEVDFFIGKPGTADAEHALRRVEASAGPRAGFPKEPGDDVLRIYTTRPDTLFGATYMVLAPEHPFVDRLTTAAQRAGRRRISPHGRRQKRSRPDRSGQGEDGRLHRVLCLNPVNGKTIPIWIADYVLISYGTGAIMAVPAHDLRDLEFAVQFNLPIVPVVEPPARYEPSREETALARTVDGRDGDAVCRPGDGDQLGHLRRHGDGRFKKQITADLAAGRARPGRVNYKLRDWLFSRQHFWGEPFPIWHELDASGQPDRPDADRAGERTAGHSAGDDRFHALRQARAAAGQGAGRLALQNRRRRHAAHARDQHHAAMGRLVLVLPAVHRSEERPALRRPGEGKRLDAGRSVRRRGRARRAAPAYSRFWHKVLFDRGYVSTAEPFRKLVNQGMILGEAELTGYRNADGRLGLGPRREGAAGPDGETVKVDAATSQVLESVRLKNEDVTKKGDEFVLKADPAVAVESRAYKMSKSRGNVVNPDTVVVQYGADALRMYEMFMGPLEATKPWSMTGVEGISRFLARVWRMIADERADEIRLNPAVQDVARDRRATAAAAPDDQGRHRRFRKAVVQHGDQPVDGIHQRDRPGRAAAEELDGTVRAAVESARAAPGGGAVAIAGARGDRWPTSRGPSSTRRCSPNRWSRFPCRSTASCGARFASPAGADQATVEAGRPQRPGRGRPSCRQDRRQSRLYSPTGC